MPNSTKDTNGEKNHPVIQHAKSGNKGNDKTHEKGSSNGKPSSPTGSHNKGEKKTTP